MGRASTRSNDGRALFHRWPNYQALEKLRQEEQGAEPPRSQLTLDTRTIRPLVVVRPPATVTINTLQR